MASRLLTINLRNYLVGVPRRKRVMKISSYIKNRISKSTNVRVDNIRINMALNSVIMKKHLNSMKPLKVSITMDKEIANVTAFDDKPAPKATAATASATKQTPKTTAPPAAKPAASSGPKMQEPKKEQAKSTDAKQVKA